VVAAQRRRGQELEDALLDAAWEELATTGYAGFTIESVAERAHTSRPVLYRRWPSRADLAIAAVMHRGLRDAVTVPDTGNVRDDLIGLLREATAKRVDVVVMFSIHMAAYFEETKSTLGELRERLMEGRPSGAATVLQRGVDRGEIDPAKLTPRIASVPFDLMRHELMMTLQPLSDETITEIVDEVFLPLVRPTPPTAA
jgi:AcrR family transcriptional regulator